MVHAVAETLVRVSKQKKVLLAFVIMNIASVPSADVAKDAFAMFQALRTNK
jgi:hypothetical protein